MSISMGWELTEIANNKTGSAKVMIGSIFTIRLVNRNWTQISKTFISRLSADATDKHNFQIKNDQDLIIV